MAYCDSCGAYIPDGQNVCLACGFDKTKEKETASAAAAARAEEPERETKRERAKDAGNYYSFTNEELKERLAEQRKRQQEESRRWAEEEKARRAASREKEDYETPRHGEYRSSGEKRQGITGSKTGDGKLFGALSYLGILFLLPMLICRDDELAQFHAKQGLGLFLFGVLTRILGFIPFVGPVLKLFRYYCIYKGMSSAIKGSMEELPYIGRFFTGK